MSRGDLLLKSEMEGVAEACLVGDQGKEGRQQQQALCCEVLGVFFLERMVY